MSCRTELYKNLLKISISEDDIIRSIAEEVKKEIGSCSRDSLGKCIYASDRLYEELKKVGVENVRLVEGYILTNADPPEMQHNWVEVDGKILDITCDQFNDIMPAGEEFKPIEYPADKNYYIEERDVTPESK